MSRVTPLFNFAYQQVANFFGQQCNIFRPNFNQVDQTPTLVGSNLPLFIQPVPAGYKYLIPPIAGVNYFTITGDRFNFRAGDIITPSASSSNIPPITVLNLEDNQPAVGFRTSRICNIVNTINTGDTVYTNVRFDFASLSTSNEGLIEDLAGALKITNKKIVVWPRQNIRPQSNLNEIAGMRIIEIDGTVNIRYVIQTITLIGNLIVFSVEQEVL